MVFDPKSEDEILSLVQGILLNEETDVSFCYVFPMLGRTISQKKILDHRLLDIATTRWPRQVFFANALPLNHTGKLSRRDCAALARPLGAVK
jgi:acyl-CoA synthetase (AMP-forming)/AMP-acid ligase II